jgi:4-carboxymuconolactone decarboxylase
MKFVKLVVCITLLIILTATVSYAQSNSAGCTFPKGEKAKSDNFTGSVWVHMIVAKDSIFNTQMATVTFEPGARTNWHSHPSGQILVITSGSAYYQEKGKQKRVLTKGEVVKCYPGVTHWHGATPNSEMTHMAVSADLDKGAVVWGEKVSDEDYNNNAK